MKEYPSIPNANGTSFREILQAYIMDKLDGSSMRSEYSKKKGWYKHGKRHGLIDNSNPHLVQVPELFMEQLSEPLTKIAVDNKWEGLIVFYEFWGAKSIAGLHFEDDKKFLTLFDAAPHKHGILLPKDFLNVFAETVPCAPFLGIRNFTRGFVEEVRSGVFPGISFEGVVAKGGAKHNNLYGKAKTQKWLDKVLEIHGKEKGQKLITS